MLCAFHSERIVGSKSGENVESYGLGSIDLDASVSRRAVAVFGS
jgi:hypothetical protein